MWHTALLVIADHCTVFWSVSAVLQQWVDGAPDLLSPGFSASLTPMAS